MWQNSEGQKNADLFKSAQNLQDPIIWFLVNDLLFSTTFQDCRQTESSKDIITLPEVKDEEA